MAVGNFENCLNVTFAYEGGWADHSKDPGGATMKGVTLATFRRWKPGATKTDLRNISTDMLQKIYRADYWDDVKGDTLARGPDLATFDYGVHSGPTTARKQLLKVLGGSACRNGQTPLQGPSIELPDLQDFEDVRQRLVGSYRCH